MYVLKENLDRKTISQQHNIHQGNLLNRNVHNTHTRLFSNAFAVFLFQQKQRQQ